MSEVTVVLSVNEVTVSNVSNAVELTSPGPQGPAGPQGLPGAAGGAVFVHSQPTPASTWIIDHSLGRAVQVTIFDISGNVVYSDVAHGTVNQTTIAFASPVAGSALIS